MQPRRQRRELLYLLDCCLLLHSPYSYVKSSEDIFFPKDLFQNIHNCTRIGCCCWWHDRVSSACEPLHTSSPTEESQPFVFVFVCEVTQCFNGILMHIPHARDSMLLSPFQQRLYSYWLLLLISVLIYCTIYIYTYDTLRSINHLH